MNGSIYKAVRVFMHDVGGFALIDGFGDGHEAHHF